MGFAVRQAYGNGPSARGVVNGDWVCTQDIELGSAVADSAVRRAVQGLHQRGLVELSYFSGVTRDGNTRQIQHFRLGDKFGVVTKPVYRGLPETVRHVVELAALEAATHVAQEIDPLPGGKREQVRDQWMERWHEMWRRFWVVALYRRRALDELGVSGGFSPARAACQVLSTHTAAVGGLTWWQVLRGLDQKAFDGHRLVPSLPSGWACPALATPEIRKALILLGRGATGKDALPA